MAVGVSGWVRYVVEMRVEVAMVALGISGRQRMCNESAQCRGGVVVVAVSKLSVPCTSMFDDA